MQLINAEGMVARFEMGEADLMPADGRRTRYVRGETVRLEAELTSAGFEAEGTVVWAILGPPVSYLVESRNPDGGTSSPVKVQESDLSYVG